VPKVQKLKRNLNSAESYLLLPQGKVKKLKSTKKCALFDPSLK
jgi:hypothetical protein